MKNKTIILLLAAACISLTAYAKTPDDTHEN